MREDQDGLERVEAGEVWRDTEPVTKDARGEADEETQGNNEGGTFRPKIAADLMRVAIRRLARLKDHDHAVWSVALEACARYARRSEESLLRDGGGLFGLEVATMILLEKMDSDPVYWDWRSMPGVGAKTSATITSALQNCSRRADTRGLRLLEEGKPCVELEILK